MYFDCFKIEPILDIASLHEKDVKLVLPSSINVELQEDKNLLSNLIVNLACLRCSKW